MFLFPNARRRIEELVHPDARIFPVERARHELFIFARLATLVFVAIFVPRYLALVGASAIWQVGAVAWLILPLAAIVHLARTGDLIEAQLISLFGLVLLALIVTVGAGLSPELSLGWLMLLPLEAAISGSSSMLRFASLFTIAVLLALAGAQSAGLIGGATAISAAGAAALAAPTGAYAALHLLGGRKVREARRRLDIANARPVSGSLGRDRRSGHAPRRQRRRDIGERRRAGIVRPRHRRPARSRLLQSDPCGRPPHLPAHDRRGGAARRNDDRDSAAAHRRSGEVGRRRRRTGFRVGGNPRSSIQPRGERPAWTATAPPRCPWCAT